MIDLSLRRAIACYLLRYAVNDEHGRTEDDNVYQRITEGRDVGVMRSRYSSCADLAHWLLMRLGADPAVPWLNREEAHGWTPGANLNRLVPPPIGRCSAAKPILGSIGAGDIIVIDNSWGGHVMCVIEAGTEHLPPAHDFIRTAEYGQPGGLLKRRSLPLSKVMSHVSLADVAFTREPDISPLSDYLTGEELDDLSKRLGAA